MAIMLHLISQERKNKSIHIKYAKQCLSHNVFKKYLPLLEWDEDAVGTRETIGHLR